MSVRVSILTVFPELYDSFLKTSIIARAQERGIVAFNLIRFSDMCAPKERIDEPTVGHGAGMVIKPEVVERAIAQAEAQWGLGYKIFFSPQGTTLNQPLLDSLAVQCGITTHAQEAAGLESSSPHIILVCGRYEGMDARVEEVCADLLLSIGDYVLMGGDVAALVLLEGLLRLVPDVVGKQESVAYESFQKSFLDFPAYGMPREWHGKTIPEVLRSGNHQAIATWRAQQAARTTVTHRFDWFRAHVASKKDRDLGRACIPNHYVVLMHDQVYVGQGEVGRSSITSIDLHDIARSSATYGLEKFFVVSGLADQQAIMKTFLGFWQSSEGRLYNPSRYEAMRRLVPAQSLDEVVAAIRAQEGKEPLLVTTSAQLHDHQNVISYSDHHRVWQHERPVLLILGTGQGLAQEVVDRADFLLEPVVGLTDYNHLSVRSAAAVIFDRWLGVSSSQLIKAQKNEV